MVGTAGLCWPPVPPHGRAGHPFLRASAHGRARPAHGAGASLLGGAPRPNLDWEMLHASLPIRAEPFLAPRERWCRLLVDSPSRLVGDATACVLIQTDSLAAMLSAPSSPRLLSLHPCPSFSIPAASYWALSQGMLPALRLAN